MSVPTLLFNPLLHSTAESLVVSPTLTIHIGSVVRFNRQWFEGENFMEESTVGTVERIFFQPVTRGDGTNAGTSPYVTITFNDSSGEPCFSEMCVRGTELSLVESSG